MGLDLVPEGRAKPGHESEWRQLVQRHFFGKKELSDAEIARFQEISIAPHENVGAPRVGFDPAADAWIIETRKAQTPEEIAATLKEFHGHHALPLVKCDGLPKYTHANLYGLDETSFRGKWLEDCRSVISDALLAQAWEHQMPEAAVAYGRELLAAADAAEKSPPAPPLPPAPPPPPPKCFFSRLFHKRPPEPDEPVPLSEQLDIVRTAGRWYIFWDERGHPIRAFY